MIHETELGGSNKPMPTFEDELCATTYSVVYNSYSLYIWTDGVFAATNTLVYLLSKK